MKKGGAGTAILIILLLLIIIILLFPNQVEQFLKQVNIPVGNNTYNLGQLFQQFINGSQNYVNNGNNNNGSQNEYQEIGFVIGIPFPIFNASTYNIGVSNDVTYVGRGLFFNLPIPLSPSPVKHPISINNVTVDEDGSNIDFSINLQYISGCNNINSINIQDAELAVIISSFNPSEVEYYNNYFGNSNYITADEIGPIYGQISNMSEIYNVTIQNNQYGFSCESNSIATISCNIDVSQLELNPTIQDIINEINFAGNLSLWYGFVAMNGTYYCQ
jgi:hypothetical protein